MILRYRLAAIASVVPGVLMSMPAASKPIAFAEGTTAMAEWGGTTMRELQVFYAPRFDLSAGGGYLRLISDVDGSTQDIVYGRVNYLAKRWNLESAQANVF